ncbi:MAG: hypothetical protein Q9223_007279 [Gallowayella weberi]
MSLALLRPFIMFGILQVLLSFSSAAPQTGPFCKAVPGTPSWPSKAQWDALNTSISGQLLAPLPAAAVCDASLPVFNNDSCTIIASQWTLSDFHAKDAMSMMQSNWEKDACLPVPNVHCDLKQYPKYVVNVTKSAHVKAGINFARSHNVRLIVRGTGHDFLGRSTAPNSLSIYTHNLRGLQWQDGFVPKGCPSPAHPALKVAAGHRMFEIYDAAAAHNSMIIGGQDPDVGLGGYLTGGGHSPISGSYGLGADNVLEFEIVTPSGDVKIVNPCSSPDLFFAFRGGGGSTFGVILSATLRAVPIPSMTWSHFEFAQNSSSREPFWQAAAYYHSQLPKLVKSGLMGYYNISSLSPFDPTTPLNLAAGVWILNASTSAFNAIMDPVLDHLEATYPVKVTRSSRYFSNFYDWWKVYSLPGAVTGDDQIGNRLVDEKALSMPLPKIAGYLKEAYGGLVMIANLVTGPGLWNANPTGGLGAMTPAWRKAILEISTFQVISPLLPGLRSFVPSPPLPSFPE